MPLQRRYNSPLEKSLCRRGRVIVAEDKARDRRESLDSGRERNAVFRSQGPDAARMDFINGLLRIRMAEPIVNRFRPTRPPDDFEENYLTLTPRLRNFTCLLIYSGPVVSGVNVPLCLQGIFTSCGADTRYLAAHVGRSRKSRGGEGQDGKSTAAVSEVR